MSLPEILRLTEKMDKEAKALKKDILKMCWYMRGLSYSEAMHLSWEERELVSEIIKENLDTTKKTGLPFF
jgi:hypothetical protein